MFESVVNFFFKLLLFDFFGLIAPGQFGSTRSLPPPPCAVPVAAAAVVPVFVVVDGFVIPTLFQSVIRRLLCPLFALITFPIFPCDDNFKLPVSHCGGGNIRGLVSLFEIDGTFDDDESFIRIEFSVLLLLLPPVMVLFNGLSVASIKFCERSRFVITPPPRTLNDGI